MECYSGKYMQVAKQKARMRLMVRRRLQVVPLFASGIVERAKRERAREMATRIAISRVG